MPHQTHESSLIVKSYFELPDAFDRTGKVLFEKDWTGDELATEAGIDQFSSAWQPQSPEEHRYKEARLSLFEPLWEGRIEATGITLQGTLEDIPAHAWKSGMAEFSISIQTNRINRTWEGETQEWRVRIDRQNLLDVLFQNHLRGVRVMREPEQVRPGVPGQHDWSHYDQIIMGLFWSDRPPVSDLDCARIVIAQQDQAPVESQLRDRMKLLRMKGLLP